MKKIYLLLFLVTISLAVAPYNTYASTPPSPKDSVITLYPNPTTAGIYVRSPKNTDLFGASMEIFAGTGKILTILLNYSSDRTTYVDLSGIKSEIIFVRIFDKAKNVIYTGNVLKFTR